MEITITVKTDNDDRAFITFLQAIQQMVIKPTNTSAVKPVTLEDSIKSLIQDKGAPAAREELKLIFLKHKKLNDGISIPTVDDKPIDAKSMELYIRTKAKTSGAQIKTIMREDYGIETLDELNEKQLAELFEKVQIL